MIKKADKLQDNFAILDALEMSDDVLILNLQEEITFNKCENCTFSCLNNS